MSALRPLYHVPRSQVWPGSRGGQSGKVHLHVLAAVSVGRIRRRKGAALCGRPGWMTRPLESGEVIETCPRCAALAERLGLSLEQA